MPTIKKQSVRPVVRRRSAVDRISSIGFDEDEGIKINLYGRSGTGKTTLWATFPKPILALVCSGSRRPGELRSIDTPANRKTIQRVDVKTPDDVLELAKYQDDAGKYATVVLDHASGLQDRVLAEILGIDDLPEQKSWGMASREQYGQAALKTKELLRSLLNLSCNVVIVAQEREFNTEAEGELLMPYVGSALSPSVTGWLNPACDYVVQTFLRKPVVVTRTKVAGKVVERKALGKGVEYCLRTGPDAVYTTKFRLPKGTPLPEVIVDPSYDKIVKLIQGGK